MAVAASSATGTIGFRDCPQQRFAGQLHYLPQHLLSLLLARVG
jgi:hypothetical protein